MYRIVKIVSNTLYLQRPSGRVAQMRRNSIRQGLHDEIDQRVGRHKLDMGWPIRFSQIHRHKRYARIGRTSDGCCAVPVVPHLVTLSKSVLGFVDSNPDLTISTSSSLSSFSSSSKLFLLWRGAREGRPCRRLHHLAISGIVPHEDIMCVLRRQPLPVASGACCAGGMSCAGDL